MIIFCIIYYVLSYCRFVPQIVKLIKTKSSRDYSISSEVIRYVALLSWAIYVFTSDQKVIVQVGSIIDMLLLTTTGILILKYYNKRGDK